MTNLIEVRVPDIGDYKDVEVIEVAVQAGDTVAVDATLITLETEKATMDVPSTAAGVIRELRVGRGSRVSQGDVIAVVEGAADAKPAPRPESESSPQPAPQPSPQPAPAKAAGAGMPAPQPAPAQAAGGVKVFDSPGFSTAHASPSIRRFARELGVDLAQVRGTGTKGRITEQDVTLDKRLLFAVVGTATKDSTLLMTVGLPNRPLMAGSGGFARTMPRLPSRLSSSEVSSPQI